MKGSKSYVFWILLGIILLVDVIAVVLVFVLPSDGKSSSSASNKTEAKVTVTRPPSVVEDGFFKFVNVEDTLQAGTEGFGDTTSLNTLTVGGSLNVTGDTLNVSSLEVGGSLATGELSFPAGVYSEGSLLTTVSSDGTMVPTENQLPAVPSGSIETRVVLVPNPTEGDLFYDTDQHALQVYGGEEGGWVYLHSDFVVQALPAGTQYRSRWNSDNEGVQRSSDGGLTYETLATMAGGTRTLDGQESSANVTFLSGSGDSVLAVTNLAYYYPNPLTPGLAVAQSFEVKLYPGTDNWLFFSLNSGGNTNKQIVKDAIIMPPNGTPVICTTSENVFGDLNADNPFDYPVWTPDETFDLGSSVTDLYNGSLSPGGRPHTCTASLATSQSGGVLWGLALLARTDVCAMVLYKKESGTVTVFTETGVPSLDRAATQASATPIFVSENGKVICGGSSFSTDGGATWVNLLSHAEVKDSRDVNYAPALYLNGFTLTLMYSENSGTPVWLRSHDLGDTWFKMKPDLNGGVLSLATQRTIKGLTHDLKGFYTLDNDYVYAGLTQDQIAQYATQRDGSLLAERDQDGDLTYLVKSDFQGVFLNDTSAEDGDVVRVLDGSLVLWKNSSFNSINSTFYQEPGTFWYTVPPDTTVLRVRLLGGGGGGGGGGGSGFAAPDSSRTFTGTPTYAAPPFIGPTVFVETSVAEMVITTVKNVIVDSICSGRKNLYESSLHVKRASSILSAALGAYISSWYLQKLQTAADVMEEIVAAEHGFRKSVFVPAVDATEQLSKELTLPVIETMTIMVMRCFCPIYRVYWFDVLKNTSSYQRLSMAGALCSDVLYTVTVIYLKLMISPQYWDEETLAGGASVAYNEAIFLSLGRLDVIARVWTENVWVLFTALCTAISHRTWTTTVQEMATDIQTILSGDWGNFTYPSLNEGNNAGELDLFYNSILTITASSSYQTDFPDVADPYARSGSAYRTLRSQIITQLNGSRVSDNMSPIDRNGGLEDILTYKFLPWKNLDTSTPNLDYYLLTVYNLLNDNILSSADRHDKLQANSIIMYDWMNEQTTLALAGGGGAGGEPSPVLFFSLGVVDLPVVPGERLLVRVGKGGQGGKGGLPSDRSTFKTYQNALFSGKADTGGDGQDGGSSWIKRGNTVLVECSGGRGGYGGEGGGLSSNFTGSGWTYEVAGFGGKARYYNYPGQGGGRYIDFEGALNGGVYEEDTPSTSLMDAKYYETLTRPATQTAPFTNTNSNPALNNVIADSWKIPRVYLGGSGGDAANGLYGSFGGGGGGGTGGMSCFKGFDAQDGQDGCVLIESVLTPSLPTTFTLLTTTESYQTAYSGITKPVFRRNGERLWWRAGSSANMTQFNANGEVERFGLLIAAECFPYTLEYSPQSEIEKDVIRMDDDMTFVVVNKVPRGSGIYMATLDSSDFASISVLASTTVTKTDVTTSGSLVELSQDGQRILSRTSDLTVQVLQNNGPSVWPVEVTLSMAPEGKSTGASDLVTMARGDGSVVVGSYAATENTQRQLVVWRCLESGTWVRDPVSSDMYGNQDGTSYKYVWPSPDGDSIVVNSMDQSGGLGVVLQFIEGSWKKTLTITPPDRVAGDEFLRYADWEPQGRAFAAFQYKEAALQCKNYHYKFSKYEPSMTLSGTMSLAVDNGEIFEPVLCDNSRTSYCSALPSASDTTGNKAYVFKGS